MPGVAEEESEAEEDGPVENAKGPRDSGCFECSENLEGRREEPKAEEDRPAEAPEEHVHLESEEHEQEREQHEENQEVQLDALQEQLQEMMTGERS